MTTELIFYDASVPPKNPPKADGVAGYIGGDTPHVWTRAEWDSQPPRYRLPIFTRSDPAAAGISATADAEAAIRQLGAIGAPKGSIVALDSETSIDPAYVKAFYNTIAAAGYTFMDYASQDNLFANDPSGTGGYYWGADWTGRQHIAPGDSGTQYASDAEWDLDVFRAGLPFWDTHPAKTAPSAPVTFDPETIMTKLPELFQGTTGNNVCTIQGLCYARGHVLEIDGIFGPDTEAAVRAIQDAAHIAVDGIVGPQTWPVLMGIA